MIKSNDDKFHIFFGSSVKVDILLYFIKYKDIESYFDVMNLTHIQFVNIKY